MFPITPIPQKVAYKDARSLLLHMPDRCMFSSYSFTTSAFLREFSRNIQKEDKRAFILDSESITNTAVFTHLAFDCLTWCRCSNLWSE